MMEQWWWWSCGPVQVVVAVAEVYQWKRQEGGGSNERATLSEGTRGGGKELLRSADYDGRQMLHRAAAVLLASLGVS